jgi:TetR/AcrR family transcriptional regulator
VDATNSYGPAGAAVVSRQTLWRARTRRKAASRPPDGGACRTSAPKITTARARTYVPGDERRRQILETASELFARHGFAGTTTREVAAAVGTSETVLFRHFPTKQDLYEAILEHQLPVAALGRWIDELRVIAERREDEELFGAIVKATLESFARDIHYHRLMLFAALEGHELAQIARERYSAPIVGFLRDYVALRQSEGAFKRVRPEVVVHALLASAAYYGQSKALDVSAIDVTEREVVDQAAMLLAGIKVSA